MKSLVFVILILLIPGAWDHLVQLSERYDASPEYIVNGPNKLKLKVGNEYKSYAGPFQAGGKLSYDIERFATRTVTAKTTRRIVQKSISPTEIARTPFYTFPAQPATRIDANPEGKIIISHVTVDLPSKDVLPPGKGYIIESSVEFPAHGGRDAVTYTAETEPFAVE